MEFGDKEWFKKLEEQYSFPTVIAFYLSNNGKTQSQGVETKELGMVGNIQFQKVAPTRLFDGTEMALVKVLYCRTSQDYYNEAVRIKKVWGLKTDSDAPKTATEDRKTTLLKACRDLLKKQERSGYVLDLLSQTVFYDEAECDGSCLLDDIEIELKINS